MARKKKHEEHENLERWLVSYADFITLLFAFFVVMYSISSVNEGKYRVLSDALVAAFRSPAKSIEPVQIGNPAKTTREAGQEMLQKYAIVDVPEKPVSQETPADAAGSSEGKGARAMKRMAAEIEKSMKPLIDKGLVAVRRGEYWIEVEIQTSILFPSGSSVLQAQAVPILSDVGKILKGFPNPLRVEGFTDNVPIATEIFPSNWELSAARAASVVHLFTRLGVEPHRMAAIGYGQYRPIADNSTEGGRNRNRRVVLSILESIEAERVFGKHQAEQQAGTQGTAAPAAALPQRETQ